jgi:hypothetical protein
LGKLIFRIEQKILAMKQSRNENRLFSPLMELKGSPFDGPPVSWIVCINAKLPDRQRIDPYTIRSGMNKKCLD